MHTPFLSMTKLGPTPKKRNRSEILDIIRAMVLEFDRRTDEATGCGRVDVYQHTAKFLRELHSIAEGRRSAAYWTGRRKLL